ncbi:hypothetical protein HDE_12485 [Halotydeus destructor]|nr:hypothetical protein HDE_12485 [Halotydeus destructor]
MGKKRKRSMTCDEFEDEVIEVKKTHVNCGTVTCWTRASAEAFLNYENVDVKELCSDGVLVSELVNRILSSLFQCKESSTMRNLREKLNDYAIDICPNLGPAKLKAAVFQREPVYLVSTTRFVTEQMNDQFDGLKQRYMILLVNVPRVLDVFQIVEASISESLGGLDSGIFDISDEISEASETQNREMKLFTEVLTLLVIHALGHLDLFTRHHFAYYENHKEQSSLHSVQRQLRHVLSQT